MQEFIEKNKRLVIAGTVIVVLLVVGGIFMSSRNQQPAQTAEVTQEEDFEAPIPTVDPSVKVQLEPINGGQEVEITVDAAPEGTDTIDVELSYETADKGLQGAIGTIEVDGRKGMKKITLGTCSSGTCVYHDVSSDIKVYLKFNGDYGEQIFEKSFSI
jgi:hypothetical protein